MHLAKEEESFACVDRCPSKAVNESLRFHEEEVLSCSGEGIMPGLTKAYRAPKITHHPIVLS